MAYRCLANKGFRTVVSTTMVEHEFFTCPVFLPPGGSVNDKREFVIPEDAKCESLMADLDSVSGLGSGNAEPAVRPNRFDRERRNASTFPTECCEWERVVVSGSVLIPL